MYVAEMPISCKVVTEGLYSVGVVTERPISCKGYKCWANILLELELGGPYSGML